MFKVPVTATYLRNLFLLLALLFSLLLLLLLLLLLTSRNRYSPGNEKNKYATFVSLLEM
jgi:hypothetical protein